MSPIEHVWDIVGGRLAHDLRPVVSTDELWLRIQTVWNTLPQADIQNLFNSMPRRVATLIAAREVADIYAYSWTYRSNSSVQRKKPVLFSVDKKEKHFIQSASALGLLAELRTELSQAGMTWIDWLGI
ncbi:transposable element Tcb2 transposase [Trichonephila clavipes]|nr:transposable element Tcb2 transposase [Trichonephila clavipes]